MRRLLLLGRAPNREFMLRSLLRRPDLELVVADGPHPDTPRSFADQQLTVRTRNPDELLDCVRRVHQINPIHGVMTFAETLVVLTARVASELGLPGMSVDSALLCTNKDLMRDRLQADGVPCPRYAVAETDKEARRHACDMGLPVVVKPADSHSSLGVVLVSHLDQLAAGFGVAMRNCGSGKVLIEEYMVGPEVSIEAFVVGRQLHVVTITDKVTTPGPYFLEMGHSVPSGLPTGTQAEIAAVVRRAVESLGLSNCAIHAEVKLTAEGCKIVEIGGRLGGDCISNLVWYALGIDLPGVAADVALRRRPDLEPVRSNGAAIRFVAVPDKSVFRSKPRIPTEVALAPDMKEVGVYFSPGQEIVSPGTDLCRVLSVITQATTPLLASQRANYLAGLIQSDVHKADSGR